VNGKPVFTQGIFRDITERKKAEEELRKAYSKLKEMQQRLIQSEKLAALGKFSAGVAHEVKNPLAIILSGLEFLEAKLSNADTDTKTAIDKTKKATLRASDVLKSLLKFARPSDLELERLKPDDLVNDTISFFKYKAPLSNVEIKTQFSEEEMYIEVDNIQIQQVLFNLLMNSVESKPNVGEIKIKSYKTSLPGEWPGCVIEIEDTGEGISAEDLSKLFEPFFTTKRDSKGTGLGLSISKMIVNNHEGDLTISSELGKGTEAKVILPLA
jgi:signal transduction histidine kinase